MAWPHLSPKARTLIKRIRAELTAAGVRLRIHKSHIIRTDTGECSGYFDPDSMVLAVGSRKGEAAFMALLCHEYIHFLQWHHHTTGRRTKYAKAWHRNLVTESYAAKDTSRPERYAAYRTLLALELQAEQGALVMVEEGGFGTPMEREALTKYAALYLYCHRLIFEKRRWFRDGNDLFKWLEDVNIWKLTPTSLRGVDFNRIPPKLKKLLLRLF